MLNLLLIAMLFPLSSARAQENAPANSSPPATQEAPAPPAATSDSPAIPIEPAPSVKTDRETPASPSSPSAPVTLPSPTEPTRSDKIVGKVKQVFRDKKRAVVTFDSADKTQEIPKSL